MKENQTKTPKNLFKKWWFWVLSVLLVIMILIVILGTITVYTNYQLIKSHSVAVILDPAWITHTNYKLNSKYCKIDSDCRTNGCVITNIYNLYILNPFGQDKGVLLCDKEYCGSECIDNTCHIKNCEDIIE